MTPTQALDLIMDRCPKNQLWCAVTLDEKEQVWLRVVALRIRKGTAKPATLRKFFSFFGMEYREIVTVS